MKFYNYPDPIVRTTIYQSILNLLHNSNCIVQPEIDIKFPTHLTINKEIDTRT